MERSVKNILAVAQAIEDAAASETRPIVGFNMSFSEAYGEADFSGHSCETVACIAGWTNLVVRGRRLGSLAGMDEAAKALGLGGLGNSLADDLFLPGDPFWDATPTHAVAVLRHLAETGVVDWTVGAPAGGSVMRQTIKNAAAFLAFLLISAAAIALSAISVRGIV